MLIKKIKISESQLTGVLIAFVIFFCVVRNNFINLHFGFISTMQHAANLLMFLILGFLCLIRYTKLKKTTIIATVMLMEIFIITLLNGRNLPSAISQLSPMLTVCFSLELVSRNKRAFFSYIDTLKYLLLFMVLIDFVTQIIYPNGMYKTDNYDLNWFLGYKTQRLSYSFPMLLMFVYSSYKKTGEISKFSYAVSLLVFFNSYLSQSIGCTLVVLIFILLNIALKYKRINLSKFIAVCLNPKLAIVVYTFVLYTMLFVSQAEWIQSILLKLGKSSDFSGRGTIWKVCLQLFKKYPIFGTGHLLNDDYRTMAHFNEASNAHNAIITIMLEGGIICLLLYILLFFCTLSKHRNYTTIEKRICVFIYLTLLLGLTSSILIYSSFSFFAFWLMENESKMNLSEEIRRMSGMLMHKKYFSKN